MASLDSYSKALVEVATLQERLRWVNVLERELEKVSGGVFDAKGVLRDIIDRERNADMGENK